jgi:hypothetical protein
MKQKAIPAALRKNNKILRQGNQKTMCDRGPGDMLELSF